MQLLDELVAGKRVALVGNASSIVETATAEQIDGHDIVVRMNLGLPHLSYSKTVGKRTDVWASAKYWPEVTAPADCELIVFMKLTPLGDMHWDKWRIDGSLGVPMIRWPHALEDACREFVGADPGTGIRLLWWLKTHAKPLQVSVFGFDCWKTPSAWSGRFNTPNHDPKLEQAALEKLLP
jgi:hypothetical protein